MAVTSVPCPPLQRSTRSKDTKRLYRCQQLIQRLDGWKQLGLSQCICSPHTVYPPQNHLCVKCHNTSYTLSVHTEWREEGAGGRMLLSVQLKKVRSFVPTPICPHYSATFQWECYAEWRHCAAIPPHLLLIQTSVRFSSHASHFCPFLSILQRTLVLHWVETEAVQWHDTKNRSEMQKSKQWN